MSARYENMRRLPNDRMRCHRCTVWKPTEAFARNRRDNVQWLLQRGHRMGDQTVAENIVCLQCSGGGITELFCHEEKKMRSIEQFSRTQRGNPDDAICLQCVIKKENVRPWDTPQTHESSDEDEGGHTDQPQTGPPQVYRSGGMSGSMPLKSGVPLSGEFEVVPTTGSSGTTNPDSGTTGGSVTTTSRNSRISKATSRPVEVSKSGFAKIRAGFREQHVPKFEDDDIELGSEDDEDWEM